MFPSNATIQGLNEQSKNTLVEHIGIEFIEIGSDYLVARMPVDKRTHQPFGLLHGGASVVLAETIGSVGANLCVDTSKQYCVGIAINANHLRSARSGWVYGRATPLHVGRSTQVWKIDISNEEGKPICVSRLTMAVKDIY